jgi:phospholipase C
VVAADVAGVAGGGQHVRANITNIFVLMMENRSFDHLLGSSGLTGVDATTGLPTTINGLDGQSNEWNGHAYPSGSPAVDPLAPGPSHEFPHVLCQLAGPGATYPTPGGDYPTIDMSGFVADYAAVVGPARQAQVGEVMTSCNARAQVPVLTALAEEFAVCDAWFSSMPGPTWPNRFFSLGASSDTIDDNPTPWDVLKWFLLPFHGFKYEHGSIFDLLSTHRHQYRLYNDRTNRYAAAPENSGQYPFVAALSGVSLFSVHDIGHLADDLQQPYPYALTVIEPNYGDLLHATYRGGSSQHPSDSLAAGEAMIADVYNTIAGSPVWENSILFITYDEHGGFYDHVVPPPAPSPNGEIGKDHRFDFEQLGARVPTVVISPWIPAHTIDHRVYDHTSVLRTVENNFGLPNLNQRDLWADDVLSLLSLDAPRTDCPMVLAPPPRKLSPGHETVPLGPLDSIPSSAILPLVVTLKARLELLDESLHAGLLERLRAMTTVAEAEAFLAESEAHLVQDPRWA